jgi:hypothetical protein
MNVTQCVHAKENPPEISFSQYKEPHTNFCTVTITCDKFSTMYFLNDLKDLTNFKNAVLEAYSKLLKELGYE